MTESLVVSKEDLGERVDKFLTQYFPNHSRTYFQFLIDEESVLLNGHPIKKQHRLVEGDEVEVSFQTLPMLDVKPEAIPLEILYEDESIIVVNKPSGMVVHPAPGSYSGTFANALLHHCKQLKKEEFENLRPGIVHRLDKDTSGILIAAKNLAAHQKLVEQFASRSIEKQYLVICLGVPKEGECSAPIKRHPINRKQMTINPEGKEARTHFTVLGRRKGLSLVQAKLITGRTHQIRVHLKSMNCPVLGDTTYGSPSLNQKYNTTRQMLHARSLKMIHPISEIPLEFIAPIPSDMKNLIDLFELA
ncbi:MAG: Ribosomal large subunit pseudouridine synthase D [Chlamydiae bacterium]|nr:Ribosomal large subunit pseudouridine synthase D [Chlamydiota bacterium]